MKDRRQLATNSITRLFVESILPTFVAGKLDLIANGYPAMSVNCEKKTLEIEASGMKETGIPIARLAPEGGVTTLVRESESTAKKLAEEGWTLVVYDKGTKALTMGKGASRLTGHMLVNPLKLRALLNE